MISARTIGHWRWDRDTTPFLPPYHIQPPGCSLGHPPMAVTAGAPPWQSDEGWRLATPGFRAVAVMFCRQIVSLHKDSAPYGASLVTSSSGLAQAEGCAPSGVLSPPERFVLYIRRSNVSGSSRKPSAARSSNHATLSSPMVLSSPPHLRDIRSQRGIKERQAKGPVPQVQP